MIDESLLASASVVPEPTPWPNSNRRLLLGQGAPIDPLIRLSTFTDKEFERFIWEWVQGYLSKRYVEVQARGGAGDKGRDVLGWVDSAGVEPRRWDLYQCKRYASGLAPSVKGGVKVDQCGGAKGSHFGPEKGVGIAGARASGA
jgi:hypothetical protein